MTPLVLAIIPLSAIAAILIAVWVAGGRRSARIPSAHVALEVARAADGTFEPTDAIVATDGSGALVPARDRSMVAVVFVVGDRVTSRDLRRAEVKRLTWTDNGEGGQVLGIALRDFGCPLIALPLSGEQVRAWRPLIERWLGQRGAPE